MARLTRVTPACVAIAAVTLSGCFWPAPGAEPGRQAHNPFETAITPSTVAGLEVRWQAPLANGSAGAPVTSSTGVHVNDSRGVYTLDFGTGARRWEYAAPDAAVMQQPYVWRDGVLASWQTGSSGDAATVELDAGTGALERSIPGGAVAALRGDDAVLLSSHWGCIRSICLWFDSMSVRNLETGESPVGGTHSALGPASNPQVTLGTDWVYLSGWGISGPQLPESAPGLRVYSIADPVEPCGYTVPTLCPTWEVVPGPSGVVVLSDDGATLYTGSGNIRAYDAGSGGLLWADDTPMADSVPALADGLLFAADRSTDRLHAYSAGGCGAPTCAPLWSASIDTAATQSAPLVQPAVAGGVVYVAGDSGVLHAFDAAGCGAPTCEPLWSYDLGAAITGAPAVNAGQVYVGTADGRVVAFGLPTG